MSNSSRPRPTWDDTRLCDLITTDRLRSYLAATPDLSAALSLYEWNTRAAAAVMQTVSMAEVVVRNALDRELSSWSAKRGALTWFDLAPLDDRGSHSLYEARLRATRHGRVPEVHGKVIAETSLGFWRYLAASRYLTSLWVPALHRAFPHGPSDLRDRRREVEAILDRIGFVRNRAAHHEPLHHRDLTSDYERAVLIGSWISPDAGAWIKARSTLPRTVMKRPSIDGR